MARRRAASLGAAGPRRRSPGARGPLVARSRCTESPPCSGRETRFLPDRGGHRPRSFPLVPAQGPPSSVGASLPRAAGLAPARGAPRPPLVRVPMPPSRSDRRLSFAGVPGCPGGSAAGRAAAPPRPPPSAPPTGRETAVAAPPHVPARTRVQRIGAPRRLRARAGAAVGGGGRPGRGCEAGRRAGAGCRERSPPLGRPRLRLMGAAPCVAAMSAVGRPRSPSPAAAGGRAGLRPTPVVRALRLCAMSPLPARAGECSSAPPPGTVLRTYRTVAARYRWRGGGSRG